MRRIIVGIAVVLCAVVVVFAQGRANREIDACTAREAAVAVSVIGEDSFFQDYVALVQRFGADSIDAIYKQTLREAVDLRSRYYADVQPDLPDCAGALRLHNALIASLDEITILNASLALLKEDTNAYALLVTDSDAAIARFQAMFEATGEIAQELVALAGE